MNKLKIKHMNKLKIKHVKIKRKKVKVVILSTGKANNICKTKINFKFCKKDNCKKDSWNKEEVETKLFDFAEYHGLLSTKNEIKDFNKYIEENL